jgi:hypothetical protein
VRVGTRGGGGGGAASREGGQPAGARRMGVPTAGDKSGALLATASPPLLLSLPHLAARRRPKQPCLEKGRGKGRGDGARKEKTETALCFLFFFFPHPLPHPLFRASLPTCSTPHTAHRMLLTSAGPSPVDGAPATTAREAEVAPPPPALTPAEARRQRKLERVEVCVCV